MGDIALTVTFLGAIALFFLCVCGIVASERRERRRRKALVEEIVRSLSRDRDE